MAFTANQQIFELVRKNNSFLITIKRDWSGDALAASLVLAMALKKLGKNVDVACDNFKTPTNLGFLPTLEIKNHLSNLQKFIVSLNTARTKLGEFNYDHSDGKLNIYITPEEGQFNHEDVSTSISDYKYDIIFVIGTPDLHALGTIYANQSDFFYTKPKINIDHSPKNEYFGDINVVNLASSSTSEIIYELINESEPGLIDEDIATYILSGIIMATKNFKTKGVTPHTMNLASELISKGARREQIIQCLYQNRFISTLKLWGRVLSRLNNDLDDKLIWSVLSHQDFLETSTTPEELEDVIEELIVSMPKTEIIVLIYEADKFNNHEVCAIVYSAKNFDASWVTEKFNSIGNKEIAKFSLTGVTLSQAERTIIEEIKNKIR
ncbi:MAG: DHH family phosphoesterase [Patescibacteria group bacterium]|jgi:phosphoesterase RecJ-like protein